jgi:predicted NAD/FAD-binding protein
MRVAVIGSGISGLTAAHVIARRGNGVTLYEKDGHFGGHSNTVTVPGERGEIGVDTGFIVHNRRTYPHLIRLFDELGVATQESDMSFGVRCDDCGLEYAGARGVRGMLATPGSLTRPSYLRMLTEVRRFHRHARQVLLDPGADRLTLGDFLDEGGYSDYCRDHFVLPLTGAIWSSSPTQMHEFPARYLIRFFANHGMLTVRHSPRWRTVTGGSRVYVRAILERLGAGARGETPAVSVWRTDRGVVVGDAHGGERRYDGVVIATHADQALLLLEDPTDAERSVLGRFLYSANETVLHTDGSILPRSSGARASWNYLLDACSATRPPVHVTYHMNRLQALDEPIDYCVTLNQTARIRAESELRRFVYEHPVYTADALDAQRLLPGLSGPRNTAFCGAYHGWGFHEDGCVSGIRAALALGFAW